MPQLEYEVPQLMQDRAKLAAHCSDRGSVGAADRVLFLLGNDLS